MSWEIFRKQKVLDSNKLILTSLALPQETCTQCGTYTITVVSSLVCNVYEASNDVQDI